MVTTKSFLCEDKIKILEGISNVISNTKIEGIYEFIHRQPTIIFDSAHNNAGIKRFLSEFKKDSDNYGTKIVLFGVMRDKAIVAMLIELNKYFDEIYLTEIKYERSANIKDLKNICENIGITASEEADTLNCINKFLKGNKENCLVVLGSLYLLGDIQKSLIL